MSAWLSKLHPMDRLGTWLQLDGPSALWYAPCQCIRMLLVHIKLRAHTKCDRGASAPPPPV